MLNDGHGTAITGIRTNFVGPNGWHQLKEAQIKALKIRPEYENMSFEDILKDADLAFSVRLEQGAITNPYTNELQQLATYSVFRDDVKFTELGSGFSANYNPISYKDALEAVYGDMKELGAIPARVISINGGRRAAFQFLMPDSFYAADLEHKMFAQLFAAHDGTIGVLVNSSDVTIVCCNTYAMAKADKTLRHSAKHTNNLNSRLAEIRLAIAAQTEAEKKFMEFLNKAAMSDGEKLRAEFVNYMLPEPEIREGKRTNSSIANQRAELQLAIDTSKTERNGNKVTAHDLFAGVTRRVTYRQQNRDDAEQFVYVQKNSAPQDARNWIMEKITA